MGPTWLKDAIFYEIYPQSFQDSNDDGIGDIPGIIDRLDYVAGLGCNALWINPCFDSPFMDAGYDVRDYKLVAPRYGTNEDLVRLFDEAHARGMHVLLDLVPGHTSDQHPWFKASAEADPNEYSARYIWTDEALWGMEGRPYIAGMTERAGAYMLNFFASQPALNYGWRDPYKPWMSAVDSPEALATREAIKDVMRFWLDLGCDGYRVDMADSLVKGDDERKSATSAIWRDIRAMMDREYPDAALVSEWSNPDLALCQAGFHMDFYLDHQRNGYNTLVRDWETEGGDHSYFRCDAGGDIRRFLQDYLPKYERSRTSGHISFISGNHDTPRLAKTLDVPELKLVFALILTLLRRRDRHALPRPAYQGGRLPADGQPHAHAVEPCGERGLLAGACRRALPAGGCVGRRAVRRGAAGGRRVAAGGGPQALRAAPRMGGPAGGRGVCRDQRR